MSFDLHIQKKLSLYPLLAIAFAMPLAPHFLPVLIVIWFITWFIDEPVGNKIDRISGNKFIWIFIAFYLIHVLAMLYTKNKPVGRFDLEVKTSIWLFPVLFAGASRLIYEKLNQVFIAFITGIVLSSFICVAHVLIHNDIHTFRAISYTELSYFLHPSYFALYIDLCIAFLLFSITEAKNKISVLKQISIITLIMYLIGFTYLLSSKAGIIATAIAIITPLCLYIIKKKKLIPIILLIAAILFLGISIITNQRFKELFIARQAATESENSFESSALRILVWESAVDVIKKHPYIGVGTGDIKDELTTQYDENHLTSAILYKLNVHNQFIETQLGQGILGLLALLAVFFIGFRTAILQKDNLMLVFFILCAFNFLFESMLNTQAGVIFFAFMSGLFYIRLKKND